MVRNMASAIALQLSLALFLTAILAGLMTLPGCQNETAVLNLAHRMVNGYCLLDEGKRAVVKERFILGSEHMVRITCGEWE